MADENNNITERLRQANLILEVERVVLDAWPLSTNGSSSTRHVQQTRVAALEKAVQYFQDQLPKEE